MKLLLESHKAFNVLHDKYNALKYVDRSTYAFRWCTDTVGDECDDDSNNAEDSKITDYIMRIGRD